MPARTMPTSISWPKSVWFFDLDDTVIDTSEVSAEATVGIEKVFSNSFNPEIGKKVRKEVNKIYETMVNGYRVVNDDWDQVTGGKAAFDTLSAEIARYQTRVIAKYSTPKKWSREIFIAIASNSLGIKITPELITQAADAYWQTLASIVAPHKDAVALIKTIREQHRPIFFVTSSDACLQMAVDGQFDYDPAYSETKKKARIEPLRDKGLYFDNLSIGDPEDKPSKSFFVKAIKTAEKTLKGPIDLSYAIMIGDSYTGDLQTPKDIMGFGLVVLYQKGKQKTEVIDNHYVITGDLTHLADHLSPQIR